MNVHEFWASPYCSKAAAHRPYFKFDQAPCRAATSTSASHLHHSLSVWLASRIVNLGTLQFGSHFWCMTELKRIDSS